MNNLSDKLRNLECKLAIILDELSQGVSPHTKAHFTALETLTELCRSGQAQMRLDAASFLLRLFFDVGDGHGPWIPGRDEYLLFCEQVQVNKKSSEAQGVSNPRSVFTVQSACGPDKGCGTGGCSC